MRKENKKSGFSLTEVLMAVGTLAVGMIFVGGMFLAGIYYSTVATERTIAAVAADEAFAKVRLYGGIDPNLSWVSKLHTDGCNDFGELLFEEYGSTIDPNEYAYPSTRQNLAEKGYFWSALCRLVDPNQNNVQVTVFVSRKTGTNTKYRNPFDLAMSVDFPRPVRMAVTYQGAVSDELDIEVGKESWVNDGSTIVENTTGDVYRVLERYASQPNTILLDRPWQGGDFVWAVPPPISGGRYPCIAVYQKVIRF